MEVAIPLTDNLDTKNASMLLQTLNELATQPGFMSNPKIHKKTGHVNLSMVCRIYMVASFLGVPPFLPSTCIPVIFKNKPTPPPPSPPPPPPPTPFFVQICCTGCFNFSRKYTYLYLCCSTCGYLKQESPKKQHCARGGTNK